MPINVSPVSAVRQSVSCASRFSNRVLRLTDVADCVCLLRSSLLFLSHRCSLLVVVNKHHLTVGTQRQQYIFILHVMWNQILSSGLFFPFFPADSQGTASFFPSIRFLDSVFDRCYISPLFALSLTAHSSFHAKITFHMTDERMHLYPAGGSSENGSGEEEKKGNKREKIPVSKNPLLPVYINLPAERRFRKKWT